MNYQIKEIKDCKTCCDPFIFFTCLIFLGFLVDHLITIANIIYPLHHDNSVSGHPGSLISPQSANAPLASPSFSTMMAPSEPSNVISPERK